MLDSKKVQMLLEEYHLLCFTTNIELIQVKLDLDRALLDANLTKEERQAVYSRFLAEPEPPISRTGMAGRPKGGTTHQAVAPLILGDSGKSNNARAIDMTRLLQSAYNKISETLGATYFEKEDKQYSVDTR